MNIALVFPHQLYRHHPAIDPAVSCVYLIEDALYFTQLPFHQQKLLLHRLSMKGYEQRLRTTGMEVCYCDVISYPNLKSVFVRLAEQGAATLHVTDPTDFLLQKRLIRLSNQYSMPIVWTESPNFLTPLADLTSLLEPGRGYLMARFYANQRRRLHILLDAGQKPVGGKWSFDAENRQRVPAGLKVPRTLTHHYDELQMADAVAWVGTHFGTNVGTTTGFNYPVDHDQAEAILNDFVAHRLGHFGAYEDAMVAGESQLWHSVLTPALNIGLLNPDTVLDAVLDQAERQAIPLASLEGFIRQVVGWREFMRAIYLKEGVRIRTANFLNHRKPLPAFFWQGNSGLPPFDDLFEKLHRTAYSHHIERLMVAGNLLLLLNVDPDEVYCWFMTYYIDAYDWVMVPNVYSMSQYADGGLITTKPYVSGSAYLLKMSNFGKGPWCAEWDSLYWSFMDQHREVFRRNNRMAMMVASVDRMSTEKLSAYLGLRASFLARITTPGELPTD
jgi:deoxyribodipyrimidine photolyase-related protein